MIKILLALLLIGSNCYAANVTLPTTYANGGTVTASNLNGNFTAITAQVNGGLDNDNANTGTGYRFYETKAALPSAGSQGRTVFLTSDNSLNLDTGAAWVKTITPSGTPSTGYLPYYNSGWTLLAPGAQYYSLVSNGSSSLPSYQQVNLANGVTSTLPIVNGGTGQTTAQAAVDALLPSQSGNSGKFLTTNGSASSWGSPSNTSNVLFQYSASTSVAGSGIGEINGTSLVPTTSSSSGYRFLSSRDSGQNAFVTVWATKWKKISGVSTVTVYAQLWGNSAATMVNSLKINVGTANNTVAGTTNQVTPEWVTFTVDVSGLSNGTVYDVTAQLAHDQNLTANAFLGNLISFGS